MKKSGLLIVIIMMLWTMIQAEEIDSEFYKIEYEKKDARKAMLFSALIPGAGQAYANPKSITTYIFPLIEIGLWVGYYHYQQEGDDITENYENYADAHYVREYQWEGQKNLIDNPLSDNNFYAPEEYDSSNPDDYGEGGHFRLDHENTQHFYEDIAKYDKYVMGWIDWVDIYATSADGEYWTSPQWIFDSDEYDNAKWVGTTAIHTDSEYYQQDQETYDLNNGIYSGYRQEFIEMRKDAEVSYDKRRMCTFGMLFNHLLAAIDANRVARKYNIENVAENRWGVQVAPVFAEGTVNPSVRVSYKF